jgi:hypothetical protein
MPPPLPPPLPLPPNLVDYNAFADFKNKYPKFREGERKRLQKQKESKVYKVESLHS